MPRHHLDRLSALDALFLHQDGPDTQMHIGALAICQGPPPAFDELVAYVERRLHLVPRYRQRIAHGPLDRGRPLWVDDEHFRLDCHVHHAALRAPGGRGELLELVGRVFSTALDRSRPLWELWLVEGLEQRGFALIFKTHHAVADGIATVDLASVLLDSERAPPAAADGVAAWRPDPAPGALELAAIGAAGVVRDGAMLARMALRAATSPARTLARARTVVPALAEVLGQTLDPAPQTPLRVKTGPVRRYAASSWPLADFTLVGRAFGATLNDVVLAIVAGALRRFLAARAVCTDGLELWAMVPVSTREPAMAAAPGTAGAAAAGRGAARGSGNRVAAMRAPLPVDIADPVERLEAISRSMDRLKASPQARGTELLADIGNFAPPMLLAQVSRLAFTTRLVNVGVTNIPGPRAPLHVLGREITEAYPVVFLPRDHALAVAVLTYADQVNLGLIGDREALPELDQVAQWSGDELAELVRSAAEIA
jgi:WS/DGAT/MGAT family acyltransferase